VRGKGGGRDGSTLNHIFPLLPASPTRLSTLFKLKSLSNICNLLLLLLKSIKMFNILNSIRPVVSGLVFTSAVVSLTPAVWTISLLLRVSSVISLSVYFRAGRFFLFPFGENEFILPPSSLSSPLLPRLLLLNHHPSVADSLAPFLPYILRSLPPLPHRSLKRSNPTKLHQPTPPSSSSSTHLPPPSPSLPLPPPLEPPFSRLKMDPSDRNPTSPSMILLLLGR